MGLSYSSDPSFYLWDEPRKECGKMTALPGTLGLGADSNPGLEMQVSDV